MRFALFLLAASLCHGAGPDAGDFFEAKVRPLLVSRCHTCHGETAAGGLRLDSRAGLLRGGKSGPAAVPGKPEQSLLLQAVAHTHARLKMPPNGQLEPQEIASLSQWIQDGAAWPESPREFFISAVKPLLDVNCLTCHGPAAVAGLRLDSREALIKGGKSGPAVVPGNPQTSLLMKAVRHDTAQLKMPPAGKLSDAAIAGLAQWVKDGAVWPEAASAPAPPYLLRPDQKAFWSFQPVRKTTPPPNDNRDWNRNPVDRFIYAKLREKGLKPGAKADRATLLRRASFDLTGLPPGRAEIAAFTADKSPDAFEKRLDEMLASQQYGERWGRHWLDLVRYADTAGDAADFPVPEMYKYRNYVISSFNRDKPYDQFLREQIAGDLLPAKDDNQRWEQIVATGYITVSRRVGVSPKGDRHVTLEDTIGNFGQTMLGLSIGCARCHDHKFDPIPTADYYALYGIFDSTTYPFSGEEHNPYRGDFVYRMGQEKAALALRPFEEAFAPWKKLERQKFNEYQSFQDKKILTPGRSREVAWQELTQIRQDLVPFAEAYPPLEAAWAVSEGKPHDVKIQIYGEPSNTGALVRRGFPLILGGAKVPENEPGSGRKQLAEWLTDPANPLPARVMANRIWHYHFGKGIVTTTSDFGVRGTAPTHPELLDYLAAQLVEGGWSVKKMHKLLMLSETWQLASADVPANSAADPGNSYLWRQNRQRLDAEEISDSIRLVSGSLDLTEGGAQPFPNSRTYFYRQHEPFTGNYENPRRAVYAMQQRFQRNPFLDLFDGPDGSLAVGERRSTTTSLQALYLMNSEFISSQSAAIASRLMSAAPALPGRVDWAYETLFARPARPAELRQAQEFLTRLGAQYRAAGCGASDCSAGCGASACSAGCGAADCDARVWASFVHAMLSSNAFLFVD